MTEINDEPQTAFRRQVRDALAHLYDAAYLEAHPLAAQLLQPRRAGRLTRAQELRGLLKQAVESLRPQRESPATAPDWRRYQALRCRYVQGMSFLEVQDELGVSRRQLHRELNNGLVALAAGLWPMRVAAAPAAGPGCLPDDSGADPLRAELDNWIVERRTCEAEELVRDAVATLQPLLERRGVRLDIGSLSAALVSVDPILTRQALNRILRLLTQSGSLQDISLDATLRPGWLDLDLRAGGCAVSEMDPAWQDARLLLRHGGGDLRFSAGPGAAAGVQVSLPLASQARVLVIDDTEAVQRLFDRYLAPEHYAVVGVSSATEALTLAREVKPDAITLDVMMPAMDGWQLLRQLQANPETSGIPVIVCSVLDEPELALALGARAFVKKPVKRLDLLTALEAVRPSPGPEAARRLAEPEDT